jgi:hypothetical protein
MSPPPAKSLGEDISRQPRCEKGPRDAEIAPTNRLIAARSRPAGSPKSVNALQLLYTGAQQSEILQTATGCSKYIITTSWAWNHCPGSRTESSLLPPPAISENILRTCGSAENVRAQLLLLGLSFLIPVSEAGDSIPRSQKVEGFEHFW